MKLTTLTWAKSGTECPMEEANEVFIHVDFDDADWPDGKLDNLAPDAFSILYQFGDPGKTKMELLHEGMGCGIDLYQEEQQQVREFIKRQLDLPRLQRCNAAPEVTFPEITLTWEEWEEKFKPIQNHVTHREEFNGWLFETFGDDLQHIHAIVDKEPNNVWTLYADTGDYALSIGDGYHHVNRYGYFITKIPAEEGISYTVVDDEDLEYYNEVQEWKRSQVEGGGFEISEEDKEDMVRHLHQLDENLRLKLLTREEWETLKAEAIGEGLIDASELNEKEAGL